MTSKFTKFLGYSSLVLVVFGSLSLAKPKDAYATEDPSKMDAWCSPTCTYFNQIKFFCIGTGTGCPNMPCTTGTCGNEG